MGMGMEGKRSMATIKDNNTQTKPTDNKRMDRVDMSKT